MGEEKRGGGGGGEGLVGREELILNTLDNDLSFQPNAFVTRNYHSLGGGSLEKLGGRGGTQNFFIPITFFKINETTGDQGGGGATATSHLIETYLCFVVFQK